MTWKPNGQLAFGPENMPLYHGHVPPGESVKQLIPDCCPDKECLQRNYNRAVLLTLEKFSQAYAALLLTRHAAALLWNCHTTGHSDRCTDPLCEFGRVIDLQYATNQKDFGVYLRSFCTILARHATDLTPQWQDFTDVEQVYVGLTTTENEDMRAEYLVGLREISVLNDPIEYVRWFQPPPEGETS